MPTTPPTRMTFTLWSVCVIAAIGFAFDTYELLMLPLIVRNALAELGGIQPGTDEFARWFGLLFYVPAVLALILACLTTRATHETQGDATLHRQRAHRGTCS